jgi:ribosome biogenesis GTPase
MRLEDLGYGPFFASNREALGLDSYALARVIAEHKGAYKVRNTAHEYLARITGKQMFNASSREDYPAVGDWVAVTELGAGEAIINHVLPRKTILRRKYSGKFTSQVIATNIDMAFVIESVDRDYNLNRLERYLAIVRDGDIKPVIVLNKIDLISAPESDAKISQMQTRFKDVDVIKSSAVLEGGLREMAALIIAGETCCLLGSSGVGKSSLLNRLLGKDTIRTETISLHTGKGRHTTTAREMYFLASGGILIDNPGMREIGMTDTGAGLEDVFAEISSLARKCGFHDCTHTHEPECAVRRAVARGELDESRYEHYLKLTREAEYYEMTKLEKRRKDRQFGKFIKKAKEQHKRLDY